MLRRAVGIAALFLLLAGGLAYVLSSPHPQQAKQQQAQQRAEPSSPNGKHGESFWEKTTKDPTAFFTFWVAIFTGVLAVSTIGLWVVTWLGGRRQVSDTKILERAYITVEPKGIVPYLGSSLYDVVAHIGIHNAGRLPAKHVSWVTHTKQSNDGELKTFDIDQREFYGDNVLAPGAIMTQGSGGEKLTGVGYVYVWGEVRYDDGFGHQRWTKFCHRYNKAANQPLPGPSVPIRFGIPADYGRHHGHGNSTDESE